MVIKLTCEILPGDVNIDGVDDVLIGAPGMNSFSGAAYVMFGVRSSVPVFDGGVMEMPLRRALIQVNSSQLVVHGSADSHFGHSVSGAGEIVAHCCISTLILFAPQAM